MGNCLVTKLKESVNDDSLMRLGATRLTVTKLENPTDGQRRMQIKVTGSDTVTVIAKGSGYFSTTVAGLANNRLTQLDIVSTDNMVSLYFANDDFEVEITNKKSINTLTLGTMLKLNLSDIRYSMSLVSLNAYNCMGDIKAFEDIPNIENIQMEDNSDVYGDVKYLESLVHLSLAYFARTNLTGDVASIGKLPRIRAFMTTGTKMYGNIEDFVSNQVIAENDGTYGINLGRALPLFKFGGVTRPLASSVNSYVFWENNGQKIFVVYGSSNNYNVSNTAAIYCKGYTVEEIASKWPGYNVVRVDE